MVYCEKQRGDIVAYTDNFKQQHDELLVIAGEISQKLKPMQVKLNAESIRSSLSALSGKLKIHVAMEDKGLYSRLAKSKDPQVKMKAQRFLEEMGGIAQVFEGYNKKWQSTEDIIADPESFIKETNQIITALAQRIDKENNELHPMVDAIIR
jgi:hemerythrin-like domain-containing protein